MKIEAIKNLVNKGCLDVMMRMDAYGDITDGDGGRLSNDEMARIAVFNEGCVSMAEEIRILVESEANEKLLKESDFDALSAIFNKEPVKDEEQLRNPRNSIMNLRCDRSHIALVFDPDGNFLNFIEMATGGETDAESGGNGEG